MIAAMSCWIAWQLYDEIVALHPEWHNKDLNEDAIKAVMTISSSDGSQLAIKASETVTFRPDTRRFLPWSCIIS